MKTRTAWAKLCLVWGVLAGCAGDAGGGSDATPSEGEPAVMTDRLRATPEDDLFEEWCDVIYTCIDTAGLGTATLEDAVDGCLGDQRSVYWQLVDLGCEENFVALLRCQMTHPECDEQGSMEVCESEWAAHSECWLR
jgi:hypothetical protein